MSSSSSAAARTASATAGSSRRVIGSPNQHTHRRGRRSDGGASTPSCRAHALDDLADELEGARAVEPAAADEQGGGALDATPAAELRLRPDAVGVPSRVEAGRELAGVEADLGRVALQPVGRERAAVAA